MEENHLCKQSGQDGDECNQFEILLKELLADWFEMLYQIYHVKKIVEDEPSKFTELRKLAGDFLAAALEVDGNYEEDDDEEELPHLAGKNDLNL